MSYKVELNIYDVINKLEGQNKRRYTDNQIAKATGLHRHTIRVMRAGKHEPTFEKLLNFFAAEGMSITPNDIFKITNSDTVAPADLTILTVDPADAAQ